MVGVHQLMAAQAARAQQLYPGSDSRQLHQSTASWYSRYISVNAKSACCLRALQDEVLGWERRLAWLQEGLALLQEVQRRWVYLEPIFARGALPQQQARFRNVDDEFRRVLAQLEVGARLLGWLVHTVTGWGPASSHDLFVAS